MGSEVGVPSYPSEFVLSHLPLHRYFIGIPTLDSLQEKKNNHSCYNIITIIIFISLHIKSIILSRGTTHSSWEGATLTIKLYTIHTLLTFGADRVPERRQQPEPNILSGNGWGKGNKITINVIDTFLASLTPKKRLSRTSARVYYAVDEGLEKK